MGSMKVNPPVCKGCLYPPDTTRKLLMFESINSMFEFINKKNGTECEDDCDYPENSKGFLLQCPQWQCERGYEIDSIETLVRTFNWQPEEIDPESEEYEKRVEIARAKSAVENFYLISEIFKG